MTVLSSETHPKPAGMEGLRMTPAPKYCCGKQLNLSHQAVTLYELHHQVMSCRHAPRGSSFDVQGVVKYGAMVEEGEKHACDTVGAMLKILKSRKVIDYKGVFLMFPMHKDVDTSAPVQAPAS
eukprot:5507984-Amphidinium_carterae.1